MRRRRRADIVRTSDVFAELCDVVIVRQKNARRAMARMPRPRACAKKASAKEQALSSDRSEKRKIHGSVKAAVRRVAVKAGILVPKGKRAYVSPFAAEPGAHWLIPPSTLPWALVRMELPPEVRAIVDALVLDYRGVYLNRPERSSGLDVRLLIDLRAQDGARVWTWSTAGTQTLKASAEPAFCSCLVCFAQRSAPGSAPRAGRTRSCGWRCLKSARRSTPRRSPTIAAPSGPTGRRARRRSWARATWPQTPMWLKTAPPLSRSPATSSCCSLKERRTACWNC